MQWGKQNNGGKHTIYSEHQGILNIPGNYLPQSRSLLFLRCLKVVPFEKDRRNKLPKGGDNDSMRVTLWMEPLQKVSMILLSTCWPPGRVEGDIADETPQVYQTATPPNMFILSKSGALLLLHGNSSHNPDAKYLQNEARLLHQRQNHDFPSWAPLQWLEYPPSVPHLLPLNHTGILWTTISCSFSLLIYVRVQG